MLVVVMSRGLALATTVMLALALALGSACTTRRNAIIGIAAGAGIAVTGAAIGATRGDLTDHEFTNQPSPWKRWGAVVLVGLTIAVISGINLGAIIADDSNARERERVTPPVPVGATIRGEGSTCTGRLDRCGDGLVCDGGVCVVRPTSAPGSVPPLRLR